MTESPRNQEPGARFYRRRADVRYRVVTGQAVIIVQEAGEAIVLNEVGTRVFELIDRGKSHDEIVQELCDSFDASETQVRADLEGYLLDLEEAGVIEQATSPETD